MNARMREKLWATMGKLKHDERGVTALEYAILAGLVAVALIAIFGGDSGFFSGIFSTLKATVTSAIQ